MDAKTTALLKQAFREYEDEGDVIRSNVLAAPVEEAEECPHRESTTPGTWVDSYVGLFDSDSDPYDDYLWEDYHDDYDARHQEDYEETPPGSIRCFECGGRGYNDLSDTICTACEGAGRFDKEALEICKTCNGMGGITEWVEDFDTDYPGLLRERDSFCPDCRGEGRVLCSLTFPDLSMI
jgi:hypothetical protein